jgi:hypothetical protein
MSLALGIFDVFAYAVPGSLYLGIISYVAVRLHWLDLHRLDDVNATLLLVMIVLASYLIGHVSYIPRSFVERAVPARIKGRYDARLDFLSRVPEARGRRFLDMDKFVLLVALEVRAKDSAIEINRLRATGLMLRNTAVALWGGALVAASELCLGGGVALSVSALVFLLLAGLSAIRHGFKLIHWAVVRTLELAFCFPDIDELPDTRPSDREGRR